MADYTLVAKLTAKADEFVAGFKKAEGTVANLQGKVSAYGKKFQNLGKQISGIGDSLTKKITKPALIATTAATGLIGALGFKRLVGLDSAQAKLKGLGYEADAVERISKQVETAIDGGMTTMAEGVDIAAGALAAGVKEGKDLERYIRLVGDAAVGANRPVDEMAQIFNRVQGQGKLMTQELNMIEMGLPGFAQKMADNVAGGSLEAFRDMVTNGEVGSEEFLNVMDDFAGGMAEAYSESWSGMVKNTLAYIGILGEALLSGVFEDGKKTLAGFIELLKSDELQQRASEIGEKIKESFQSISEKVKEAKQWFDNLSEPMQNLITKGAIIGTAIAVGIGPALSAAGFLITSFGTISTVISALMGPAGLVVLAIAGLIAAGIALYQNWETVKEKGATIFSSFGPLLDTMKDAFQNLKDSIEPIWESLKTLWESLTPILELVGAVVVSAIGIVASAGAALVTAIGPIINAVINLVDFVVNVVNVFIALLTGDFSGAWDYWQDAAQSAFDFFVNLFTGIINFVVTFVSSIIDFFHGLYMTLVGNSIIPDMVNEIIEWFKNMISKAMSVVRPIISFFGSVISGIMGVVRPIISFFTSTFTNVFNVTSNIFSKILSIAKSIFTSIKSFISSVITNIGSIIGKLTSVASSVFNRVYSTASGIFSNIRGFISGVISGIKGIISGLTGTVSSVFNRIYSIASSVMNRVRSTIAGVFSAIRNAWSGLTGFVGSIFSGIQSNMQSLVSSVKGFVNGVIGGINSALDLINKIPGVNISPIPQLYRGTDYWEGGFAYMNEGGRGELALLPGGTQVIPHDVSMKYAREAGRQQGKNYLNSENERYGNGEINQNITINSPDPTSPYENARKMKQASRELAMEWR